MKRSSLYRRARRHDVSTSRILESLERRALFSANVVGSVSNGILSLKGDNYNDSIVIDQAGLSGTQVRVSSGDGKTLINGQSASVIFSNITGLSINAYSGNDTIAINNANITNSVAITGTTGNQIITLTNDNVGGNLSVTSGGGQNSTDIESTQITGTVTVNVGAGYSTSCNPCWGGSSFANANEIFTLGNATVNGDLSISNASGETTTTFNNSIAAGNVTVTNGANSYGGCNFNCHSDCHGNTLNSGDSFTMNGSTIINDLTISNASDGNSVDLESSVVIGNVSVSNVVKSTNQSSFCCNNTYNLASAADSFTMNESLVGADLGISNISDGATATFTNATISGNVSINNGVGSYGQGYTTCCGQNSDSFGDFLTMNGANLGGGLTVNNGSTYNSSDLESTLISGDITVGNGLNYLTTTTTTTSHGCCGSACGTSTRYVVTTDIFTMNGTNVAGNVNVANANGYTDTTIDNSLIGNSVVLTNASGTAVFEMSYTIVGYNLTFTAGKGSTTATVTSSDIGVNATFNVTVGASVTISPSDVGGQVVIS
ncbi:MAG TPA: hypothetical protein VM008_17475 [Phycisphaerae bacterium]|nr:hypothetical protein [Phycisphaerae bacterium]